MMNKQELLQTAKPILFNTEMVKAILDGRKSCTRRVIKYKSNINPNATLDDFAKTIDDWECVKICCQYQVGDILWVRETWCDPSGEGYPYWHKADFPLHWDADEVEIGIPVDLAADDYKWSPSIHMPKEAARIFLRVTDVRVERLQDITEEECVSEGAVMKPHYMKWGGEKCLVMHRRYRREFEDLWDSTVKKSDFDICGWNANPWVWVIEFERVTDYENSDRI